MDSRIDIVALVSPTQEVLMFHTRTTKDAVKTLRDVYDFYSDCVYLIYQDQGSYWATNLEAARIVKIHAKSMYDVVLPRGRKFPTLDAALLMSHLEISNNFGPILGTLKENEWIKSIMFEEET
jgi:hypothetical protein